MRGKGIIDPIDRHVGERLRAERHRRGLTQAAVGAAIGVSFQQVQKYESAANRISPSMLKRAADALGVAVADFFPAPDAAETAPLHAIPGGSLLADLYAEMSPSRRAILLGIADELAR